MADVLAGLHEALTPVNLAFAALGVLLGSAVGVLPGVGPAVSVALLLPVTYALDPTAAFIMFAGIYYGGMYGSATTAILLDAPGESASVPSGREGHAMARAGRGDAALTASTLGCFVGGVLGTVLVAGAVPLVSAWALGLGPADYFALAVLAFCAASAALGESPARGLASLGIGLALGLVGTDLYSGQVRFTLGVPQLVTGVDPMLVTIGIFAVGEVLYVGAQLRRTRPHPLRPTGTSFTRSDLRRSWRPWLRGSALGAVLGALPLGGGEIPTAASYELEHRLSQRAHRFGHGAIEGVAGPEAANNAAATGALLPLLSVGLRQLDRGGDPRGVPGLRHRHRAVPARHRADAGLGADRVAARRRRAAARAAPLPRAGLGDGCCGCRATTSTRSSWCSPRSARTP